MMSRTGYTIYYANCPVIWSSKLQTEIALSTTEAEYIALSQSLRDVLPLISLLRELKQWGDGYSMATKPNGVVYLRTATAAYEFIKVELNEDPSGYNIEFYVMEDTMKRFGVSTEAAAEMQTAARLVIGS